jgi:hypothetical protein
VYSVLLAGVEENLHADADAEQRTSRAEKVGDHLSRADSIDPSHAGRVGPDAGDDESVGVADRVRIRGDVDAGTDSLQCALGRAKVPRPVIEDDDTLHR